jgi:hypothetical protein
VHAGRHQRNRHRGSHQEWPLPDRMREELPLDPIRKRDRVQPLRCETR